MAEQVKIEQQHRQFGEGETGHPETLSRDHQLEQVLQRSRPERHGDFGRRPVRESSAADGQNTDDGHARGRRRADARAVVARIEGPVDDFPRDDAQDDAEHDEEAEDAVHGEACSLPVVDYGNGRHRVVRRGGQRKAKQRGGWEGQKIAAFVVEWYMGGEAYNAPVAHMPGFRSTYVVCTWAKMAMGVPNVDLLVPVQTKVCTVGPHAQHRM